MTIKNKKLTMNLIGGGVFAIANIVSGSALATSITQTFSFSSHPGPSDFAVQLFDSTLGTLNSVDATLSGTWTASGNAFEPFPGSNATANIFVHGILELSGNSAIAVDLSALTIDLSGWSPAVTIVGGNSPADFSHEVSGSASTSVSGILLADFIQTGGGVLGVDLNFGGAGSFISTNALAYGITNEFGNAQLTLTYDYTQASSSVPEPATIALLSAGLFAYGAVRRHRQY